MIHLMLSGRVDLPSADPVGRTHWGWWDGMSDEECYRVNRWRWKLGERADSESFALFSTWNNEKTSRLVRSAIESTVRKLDTEEVGPLMRNASAEVARATLFSGPVRGRVRQGPALLRPEDPWAAAKASAASAHRPRPPFWASNASNRLQDTGAPPGVRAPGPVTNLPRMSN